MYFLEKVAGLRQPFFYHPISITEHIKIIKFLLKTHHTQSWFLKKNEDICLAQI